MYDKEDWLPEHGSVDPKVLQKDLDQIQKTTDDIYQRLHKTSFRNRKLLELEKTVCCFHCFSYMVPESIQTWVDNGETAVCPYCGVDAILPSEFSRSLLGKMFDRYFTV